MQIVIDIPKEMMSYINKNEFNAISEAFYGSMAMLAIKNGTPLPEHHGRLGDLDVLEAEMINGIKAGNYEEGYETFAHINDMDDCIECVKYADTIIEADMGSEEE